MVRALVIGSAASIVSVLLGGPMIQLLERLKLGKAISDEGPESHHAKAGTPTMGGVLILAVILVFSLTTNVIDHNSIFLLLGVMGLIGVVAVWDDLLTIQGRERIGGHELGGLVTKAGVGAVVGLIAGIVVYYTLDDGVALVPHYGLYELNPGYIAIAVVVVSASTSAAAVSDGLDGLLAGLMAIAFAAYGVIAGMQGQTHLATFCFTVVGAILGFLWYNGHPARVFMGETGAMPLGAALGVVALMTGWWLLLPVIGIVFVLELASDFVQIGSFRLTGRRPLRMAPLHHHFELSGWPEPHVVLRFWLVGAVGAILGVALALTE
ncbi:MAG: phospho-N-acetylmuramoyl-pentapeptide-transferase [Dehalococcoidia bacterium]